MRDILTKKLDRIKEELPRYSAQKLTPEFRFVRNSLKDPKQYQEIEEAMQKIRSAARHGEEELSRYDAQLDAWRSEGYDVTELEKVMDKEPMVIGVPGMGSLRTVPWYSSTAMVPSLRASL